MGNGFWTVAALLNFVKSYDPLVIFASVGYRHDFQEDFLGVDVQPGEHFTYSCGVAFAVNDDCSLVSELFGEYQGPMNVDGRQMPSSSFEPIALRLSMVRRITPTSRIQPFLAFALNQDAQDVSFGILYTRDVKGPAFWIPRINRRRPRNRRNMLRAR